MEITFVFLLGLVLALIGVIPPGLLNMTAAKISLKEGHVRGIMFSVGACVTVLFQTYIATIFLMSFSSIGVIQSVLDKRKIRCACLGAVFNLPMSTITIIENLTMVVMACVMLWKA